MARDMAKKYVSDMESRKRIYTERSIRFRNDSGIKEALDEMSGKTGQSVASFIVDAVREKLIADGYLSSEPEQREDG